MRKNTKRGHVTLPSFLVIKQFFLLQDKATPPNARNQAMATCAHTLTA